MSVQLQFDHLSKSGEVIEVRIQWLGVADERDDASMDDQPLYVLGWTVDGRRDAFAPLVEIGRYENIKDLEEMAATPKGPLFANGGAGFESFAVFLVYDIVEELLRESWRHGGCE